MEELFTALEPLIRAVETHDGDTLSSHERDSEVIWVASGSWSPTVSLTLGHLRAIAKAYRSAGGRPGNR
jgi:hypothetical protein